jgi:hypothetical protein
MAFAQAKSDKTQLAKALGLSFPYQWHASRKIAAAR